MKRVIKKVFGDPQAKTLKKIAKRADAISAIDTYVGKKAPELKKLITEHKEKVRAGEQDLEDITNDVFAMVREASVDVLGLRHFDVQLIGGLVLHEGSVAEMRTGEGKTLVATLPVVLNALSGEGVHVVTVNDYLAKRDAGWMGILYDALGLSVSVIVADESYIFDAEYSNEEHSDERLWHLKPCTRQEAYNADITYGTNNEFGFDYLRDNMVRDKRDLRQRPLAYAIVDEVDSILIDEARTPLIISAPAASSASEYATFSKIARQLKPEHYEKDEKRKTVVLNDGGTEKVQEILNLDNLYGPENVRLIYHLDQALRAETLFHKDKDYVVNEAGEVVIVDEFTGRLMNGRRYSEGLHQAIEAKEGVEVLQESMTLATISFQNLFRLYGKLAGMTGTAVTEAEEFYEIYKLDVVEIPTNREIKREDRTDRIYKTEKGKFAAIVKEVAQLQEDGRAVLIGTTSIEKNEELSRRLAKAGITHQVLNAKNNEGEAAIVAKAGQSGAVTLATNIAGRGTDIVLDEQVKKAGGLVVIGSERHESRRIDNQLRGRCGRQGDPGMTQFYVSAEDELMRIFGGVRVASLMDRLGVDEETPIENKAVSKALENAQKKVESHNFDIRKNVVKYDDVMNRQRKAIYGRRRQILEQEDISDVIKKTIKDQVQVFTPKNEKEDLKELLKDIDAEIPFTDTTVKRLEVVDRDSFIDEVTTAALKLYEDKEKEFGAETMRKVEREVHMQVLDNLWMQHLEDMQHLRQGIGWRGVAQKDPLVEYRREGQIMFADFESSMGNEVMRTMFRAAPAQQQPGHEGHDHGPLVADTELTKAAERSSIARAAADEIVSKKAAKKQAVTERVVAPVDEKAETKKRRDAKKKKKAARKKGRR